MGFWDDIWNVIWFFFWMFAFIAYLFALFSVVGDLFRDRELSGGWKAVWFVLLVFVPFLTVLVYLVVRGSGMAARSERAATRSQAATEEYIRSVAGVSPADEIAKARALYDAGAITDAEFAQLKARALAGSAA